MFGVRTVPLLAVLGLLAAGCIAEIEHSIVDKPAAADKRLAGVWALEASGSAQVLVLRAEDDNPDRLHATHVIVADDAPPAPSRATLTFTQIGSRPYFEVNWKTGQWLPLDPPVRRTFGTFEMSGAAGAETLKVCLADTESFEAPLKAGALKGFVGAGKSYERRMVLSSEGPALRAYLEKNHFKCLVSATFQRVTGPAQSR